MLAADTVAEMLTQQSYGPVGPDSADGALQRRGIGLGWHLDLPHPFTHWGFTGTFVALACQDLTGQRNQAKFEYLEITH